MRSPATPRQQRSVLAVGRCRSERSLIEAGSRLGTEHCATPCGGPEGRLKWRIHTDIDGADRKWEHSQPPTLDADEAKGCIVLAIGEAVTQEEAEVLVREAENHGVLFMPTSQAEPQA